MRGLKFPEISIRNPTKLSHLTQVRGLKYGLKFDETQAKLVAPHAGAWIEIIDKSYVVVSGMVAPHAGAAIEKGILLSKCIK